MSTSHVLVIDSDHDRGFEVAGRAKSEGWDVGVAIGDDAAKQAVTATPTTLVLVDSGVWRHDGLAAWFSSEHPTLPVIVMTAREDPAKRVVEQLQLGAMTFVPRDSGRRLLVDTIRTIIGLSRRDPYREGVREFLRSGEVELHLNNDPMAIPMVVGYLRRLLEDYGLTSAREQSRVGVAISEAISNSMIHGNLEISSEVRSGTPEVYYQQIDERKALEPFAARQVHVIMRFSQSAATFVVRDQGKGFDRAALPDPTAPENLTCASGRGILLMRAYCDTVSWNVEGNEATLTKVLKP